MSDLKYEDPESSKLPIAALTARVTTLVTLAVSMGLLRSNSVTFHAGPFKDTFTYYDVGTYQYAFFGMVVGFGYNLLLLPFSIFFFLAKKRLINNSIFVGFEFYGDKICLTLLATVVGSLYGSTVERMKGVNDLEVSIGGYVSKDYHLKIDEFCTIVYISSAFLLIGFFSSTISSIISSRALAYVS